MPISIIIPSYNRVGLLRKTLESIVTQTSSEWECIVVDDFSIDDTREVVLSYVQKDERITYYLNEHKKGAQGARNTGLDHSKYEWVFFFDSDNQLHPTFIEKMVSALSNEEGVDVIACCSDVIDVEKGKTGKVMNPRCYGRIHDNLFVGRSYVDFNHAIIRKSKLFEIGCLDEDCPSMQEWDTHIRLSEIGLYSMINESLVDYFVGGEDAISSNKKREVIGRLFILRKHLPEWKKRPKALTFYSYQIYSLIKMNKDKSFVDEKMRELRQLVPFLCVRVAISRTWSILSKLK